MKKLKWWMGLMMAGCTWMLAGASAAVPQPRASETSGGVTWSYVLQGETAVLMGANPVEGTLTIPSSLGGYPVTTIANKAFYDCTNLTSVMIPEGVKYIDDNAFQFCDAMTSVSFPSTLTNIGAYAFYWCAELKSVDLPAGTTHFGEHAFAHCFKLETFTIPNGTTNVAAGLLNDCRNLTQVNIPDGVRSIDQSAFWSCPSLASVRIPESVTDIQGQAFRGCSGLTSVTIPPAVTNLGGWAFLECRGLTNVVIRGDNTMLEGGQDKPFSGCTSLEKIYVPASWEGTTKLDNSGLSSWTTVIYGEPGKELAVFDANGGSCATGSRSYELGKAYGTLPEATRTRYAFAGWWTAAEGGTRVIEASLASVEGKRTLYAHWTLAEQAVTFYGNGGLVVSGDASSSSWYGVYSAGQAYGTLPVAERAQYSFDGWYTAASGGERVLAGDMVEGSDTRTLYAHWTLAEQVVTFYANGGNCATASRTYEVGGTYSPLPEATREEYAFAGWWTSSYGGERVEATAVVTESETRTLYAHWTPINQVVTFNANGGSCTTVSRVYEVGAAYGALPVPVREHYAFGGWWTSSGGGEKVEASSVVTPEETRTLYAHWTLAEQVVTFDANGGSCATATRTFEVGQAYAPLPGATREEYAFAGWWTSRYGGERVDGTTVVTATENRTLYAHWTPINQVVTFYANGGSCATASRTYAVGQPYGELPVAERVHWAFAGWYAYESDEEPVTADSEVTPEETRTLYARWTLGEQVVAFDANGGVCAVTGRLYVADGTYSPLPEATREGYAFAGWWSAAEGGTAVAEADAVSGGETRLLYAHWTLAEQVVTFFENGGTCGTATRTYAVGSPYGWLPVAERAGVEFAGWYEWSGGVWVRVTAESEVTAERTRWLCALWKDSGVVLPAVEEYGPDPDGGGYMVRFTGAEGKTYFLQRTPDLGAGNAWSTVETLEADRDGSYQMAALRPSSWPKGFYRVVEVGEGDKWLESYLVVDMAGGASAACWPVSLLSGEPEGGWSDEYKTTKLVLRLLAPDTFTMGSPYGEAGREEDYYYSYLEPERQHGVTLTKPYHIGVFEVTQKQWELATGSNPSSYAGGTRPVETVSYNDIRGASSGAGWPGSDAVDAGSFLGVLRAKTGLQFDLPTEAEWEYACRAGTTTALNSGKNLSAEVQCPEMNEVGRYWYNRSETVGGYAQHTVVGSYQPNAWGLYDMHGNVAEWCRDWYVTDLGSTTVTNPVGSASGYDRAYRGGSWTNYARYCRSASRADASPSERRAYRGLRVSCPEVGTYRVRFDANGGSGEMEGQRYVVGNDRLLPANTFERMGYSLAGWATSATGTVVIAAGDGAARLNASAGDNVRLYAVWRPNAYSIRFDANGGTGTMPPQAFTYNVPQALATNAFTRTGYEYRGWATNAGGTVVYADGETVLNLTAEANGVVPLYAVWEPISYRIRFGANGGNGIMEDQVCVWDVPVELFPNAFTHPDCTFAGWATNASGEVLYGNAQLVSNLTSTAGATVPLYAQWTSLYTVRFIANGGTCDTTSRTYAVGGTYTPLPGATREHYAFAGWWTSSSGGEQVLATDLVTERGPRTLYAHWVLAEQVVTFDANGGRCDTTNHIYAVGQSYATLPEPTREHYAFAGWWTSSSGGVQVLATDTVTEWETRTLYAHWTLAEQVGTFDANGGRCDTTNRVYAVGQPYATLPEPTREHYAFAGWWTSSGGGLQVLATDTVTEWETRTLYAHWTLEEQVVTFNANGGRCDTANHVYAVGQPYATLPEPTREHCAFSGWWTSSKGGVQVLASDTVAEWETRTLYAHWTALGQEVSFDANGGECDTMSHVYADGEAYGWLPEATRTHYVFTGWWTAAAGGNPVGATDIASVDGPETLYAHWTLTEQVVEFDANGGVCGTESRTYAVGKPYDWLPDAEREEYSFAGWFTEPDGGERIDESSVVTAEETRMLHAQWIADEPGVVWSYEVVDGKVTVTGVTPASGDLTIPSTLEGLPVTAIGREAFYRCEDLTGMTIPVGVTNIGSRAFFYCTGLTNVLIPDGVTGMGAQGAFWGCSGLADITIPDSVTSLGTDAFRACSGLTNVVISRGVTEIGKCVFAECSGLQSVDIPDNVTSLGNEAFAGCKNVSRLSTGNGLTSLAKLPITTNLMQILIGNNVREIGNDIFSGCGGLADVTIPDSVTKIGARAFSGCTALSSLTIPDSVTDIGTNALSGCSGLTTVTIPQCICSARLSDVLSDVSATLREVRISESVTNIGDMAFCDCSGLTMVTIPGSVTKIGDQAFSGCTNLSVVNIHDLAAWCGIYFGRGDANPLSFAKHLHVDGEEITELTIPNSVSSIGHDAFSGCSGLTSVTIPDSVMTIEWYAFSGCSGLTRVTIGNGVKSIGSYAFLGCSRMEAFSVASGNPNYQSVSGLLLTKDGRKLVCGVNGDVVIPDGVTSIGEYAFSGCSGLTSVTIPDSVMTIEWYAFSGCHGLQTLYAPESWKTKYVGGQFWSSYADVPEECEILYSGPSKTSKGVPCAWLEEYALGNGTVEGYEAASASNAVNRAHTMSDCCLAGLDPTDSTAGFTTNMTCTNG